MDDRQWIWEVFKIKKLWLAIFVTVLALNGCSGVQVNQDYDPTADFKSMNAYRWAVVTQDPTGDLRIDNPLREARIRAAVERLLAEKGFIKSANDAPTFLVRYQYVLRRKIETDGASGGIGFGMGSYGRHGGIAIGTGTGNSIREYDEGSLVIDIVDETLETLLWRGTGVQRFREYDDPAKTSGDINTLVEKILDQFPPITQK